MEYIFIFLSGCFLFVYLVGKFLEKIRVPWIFAALLLGSLFAIYNPFSSIIESETFVFIAQLGMYFLLMMIGMELDLNELKSKGGFIIKSTLFIIIAEAIAGSLLIHFLFDYSWFISFLVSLSFATVGEAILIPILDEFKIINTKLGQAIIGIGTIDDVLEMFILIFVAVMVGAYSHTKSLIAIGSLLLLFLMTVGLRRLKTKGEEFKFKNIETLTFFTVGIFFLFIGIGGLAEAMPLAALLAGIALRTFLPEKRLAAVEEEVKGIAYGFFVPIFFLWIGASMDIAAIIKYPLAILAVLLVSNGTKVLASYLIARREMGTRQSVLLGIGLSVRFSTSIVIIKILYDNGLIGSDLYSIMIASSIVFKFVIPVLFSNLIVRWKIKKEIFSGSRV